MKRVLFAGESWSAMTMEIKGFNNFFASRYETGLGYIDKAIEAAGYAFEFMPSHVAADKFPYTMEELKKYDVVVLSDIGADTLLLPVETWTKSQRMPNRCNLLRDYVLQGGALLMYGGYMTFSGIGGQGKWANNPVEEVLPVELVPYDDRREHCEGVYPVVTAPGHEVLEGIDEEFPFVLGYNYSKAKKDAEVVATICGDPFIALGRYGEGKSAVVSTDCSPHWAPPEFCEWKHYNTLVKNLLDFLTEK